MITKVQKWGNSFAVRIPKKIVEDLRWAEGFWIDFQKKDNQIIISSTNQSKKYTLDDMVKNINPRNRHRLILPEDKPRGQEIW